jgi:hypothetical protein
MLVMCSRTDLSDRGSVADIPYSILSSGRKSLYNMFEFSYLEKLNENDINVYLTFNYNKVSLS